MKKFFVLFVLGLFLVSGCSKDEGPEKNPIVSMDIKNYGSIKIELYPKYAPNTVANFVNLVSDGFYDGLTFHRLVPGFVLQGGDPNGDGTGGPGDLHPADLDRRPATDDCGPGPGGRGD